MHSLRSFFRDRRRLALVLVALALAAKALVPAGYMVGAEAKVLTVKICTGLSNSTQQIVIPAAGKAPGSDAGHAKVSEACPYSALSMASLGSADAPLLALALAFILLLGFLPAPRLPLARIAHLKPPLRGPPALA